MTHSDWRPEPGLDCCGGREVWDHEAPHRINDGEVDGDVSFSDDLLQQFRDDE